MSLGDLKKNWASLVIIGGIIATSIGAWNYAMAQVKETSATETRAIINEDVKEAARKAVAEAVKEQLPTIARQVAKEVVKEMQGTTYAFQPVLDEPAKPQAAKIKEQKKNP